ncbi:MAG: PAQR family membrane homeostasis protein TrhA [Bacteroidales bacterium]
MNITRDAKHLMEEIANAVTHGVGLVAAAIALPWLIVVAVAARDGWRLAGVIVFAVTALLLFTASTLYHALPQGRAKHVFRVFDHAAIYLLIAGTYTPFTIGVMRGAWGWGLFAAVWALAVVGVALKGAIGFRFPIASTVLYIAMGWIAVVAVRPLLLALTPAELGWLLAGGVVYTAGIPFYASQRRFSHAVWHLFVLGGATCHFVAVLLTTT